MGSKTRASGRDAPSYKVLDGVARVRGGETIRGAEDRTGSTPGPPGPPTARLSAGNALRVARLKEHVLDPRRGSSMLWTTGLPSWAYLHRLHPLRRHRLHRWEAAARWPTRPVGPANIDQCRGHHAGSDLPCNEAPVRAATRSGIAQGPSADDQNGGAPNVAVAQGV